MKTRLFSLVLISTLPVSLALASGWPNWRGPESTGMSRENGVVTHFSLSGENILWMVPVGGRSTPLIMDGRVFLIGPVGEGVHLQERVICLNADTGRTIWEHRFNVFLTDIVENRVGWTSPAGDPETGNIYAHGTGGELFCFDRAGKILWKRSLTEEFGRASGYGGRLHNPVLDEDRVIIAFTNGGWGSLARPLYRYLALDKLTGEVVWWAEPGVKPADPTCYSDPVIAVVDGRRIMIAGNGDGNVYGMDARTGERLWTFQFSKRGLNATVVIDGKYVYASHSEENLDNTEMGRVVCIDATGRGDITRTGEVWRVDGIKAGYASPAIANGRLYVADNSANLYAIDSRSGEVYWKQKLGRVSKGSPTVTADGVIYIGEVNGSFHVLKDAGDKCDTLCGVDFPLIDGGIDEIYGSAAVAGGRVCFCTRYSTYCLAVPGESVEPAVIPPVPQETAKTPPAFRVYPADVTLFPGESVKLAALGAAANGSGVSWSVAPGLNGTVTPDGTFTADAASVYSAGMVEARYGEQKASARVRIVREPPFREDFESIPLDGVPPGWIGVIRKSQVVERDGSRVLKKLAEDPSVPFMRVDWFTALPIAGGYTVQCDMLGGAKHLPTGRQFRPDMGLINSRYYLQMLSTTTSDALRIVSWAAVPRIQKDIPFEWKPDVWYRMKFSVRLKDGEALLRGKVWPRDEPEPAAWTIELTDPCPNTEGSPGLYGYSPGTTSKSNGPEIFFDNYEVILND